MTESRQGKTILPSLFFFDPDRRAPIFPTPAPTTPEPPAGRTRPAGIILYTREPEDIKQRMKEMLQNELMKKFQSFYPSIPDDHLFLLVSYALELRKERDADWKYFARLAASALEEYTKKHLWIELYDGKACLCMRFSPTGEVPGFPVSTEVAKTYGGRRKSGPMDNELWEAVESNDLEAARAALIKGANPNSWDDPNVTFLLERACWRGSMAIVELLFSAGAHFQPGNIHAVVGSGQGKYDDQVELLTCWLTNGADANVVPVNEPVGGYGMLPPLHRAAYYDYVNKAALLIQHGAHVNKPAGSGFTPLHIASARASLKVMDLLLEHGADHSLQCDQLGNALFRAIDSRSIEAVQILLNHGAEVNTALVQKEITSDNGCSPLDLADLLEIDAIIKLLEAHGAQRNKRITAGF